MNLKKWRSHWNVLKRFSPGYNPRAAHGQFQYNEIPHGPTTPEEAYWLFQARGIHPIECMDSKSFYSLCERKAGMDLTIAMWKEEVRDYQRGVTAYERVVVPQSITIEKCGEFPVSFLERIGLLKMVGLTIKQVGMRRGRSRHG